MAEKRVCGEEGFWGNGAAMSCWTFGRNWEEAAKGENKHIIINKNGYVLFFNRNSQSSLHSKMNQ